MKLLGPGITDIVDLLRTQSGHLPYREFDSQKARLAMKVGGEYRLRDIGLRQW